MNKRIIFLACFASLMMFCNNAKAQSAEEVVDNIFGYYNDRQYQYTIESEKQWHSFCTQSLGNDQSATISRIKEYAEELEGGSTNDMVTSSYINGLFNRYEAINAYIACTNSSKDKIETAWLSLEKKFKAFLDEYFEVQYRNGGSLVRIFAAGSSSHLHDCHKQLWTSLNNNAKPASSAKILPQIDREIAKALRRSNTSKVRAAATALKTEIRKYVATLGRNCTNDHLQGILNLVANLNEE